MIRRRLAAAVAIVAAVAVTLAGCASGDATASFDPSTPCAGAASQQMAGAYPELEARIPATLQGKAADQRLSGRFCARGTLGSLWDAGIHEEQFGGAVWSIGGSGGVQLTVFRAPGLTAQQIADEYHKGATADSTVTVVSATSLSIAGRPGFRLDLLNGESRQSILVWPSADGTVVQVEIAADVDESVVQAGIAAFS